MLVLPSNAIVAALKQLEILSRRKRQRNTHIYHHNIPLTTSHLSNLVSTTQQTNTNPWNTSIIFNYMTAIGKPTHYQLNRRLLLNLNNHTYALTSNTYDHKPNQTTITLNMNQNNAHVLYTYLWPSMAPTTSLIHTTPPLVQSHKHKRHIRKTTIFPIANHTIDLPVIRSILHQETQLITATHLVLILPNPNNIPWCIIHTPQITIQILQRVLKTMCIQTTYFLWITIIMMATHYATDQPTTQITPNRSTTRVLTSPTLTPSTSQEERLW